jgi:hypothetical protein
MFGHAVDDLHDAARNRKDRIVRHPSAAKQANAIVRVDP